MYVLRGLSRWSALRFDGIRRVERRKQLPPIEPAEKSKQKQPSPALNSKQQPPAQPQQIAPAPQAQDQDEAKPAPEKRRKLLQTKSKKLVAVPNSLKSFGFSVLPKGQIPPQQAFFEPPSTKKVEQVQQPTMVNPVPVAEQVAEKPSSPHIHPVTQVPVPVRKTSKKPVTKSRFKRLRKTGIVTELLV